ncbi:unnamed protein product [Caenorhabditis sp. 36 PRJEB53466]|nr:unnamed protein product [Caenorhabditis sp. 36 PRJEB53466]
MPHNPDMAAIDNFGFEHKPVGWVSISEIRKGDVSVVFKVTDSNGKIEAAMKVEKLGKSAELKNLEKDVLMALRDDPNSLHLLDYCYAGPFRCTVMTMAGPDLFKISNDMQKKFSDSTILRLAIRTLMAIKSLHEHCYVHRDLEPSNIALSCTAHSRNVYLLDFGSARQFARQEGGKWILRTPRDKVPFRGSLQYCSPKMHDLEEVGRVDDLWSWLYIFIEMRTYLPWTDSTHQMKYAPRKRNLLEEVLDSDPFLKTFKPIAKLLKIYKYADRPDYRKIFEILTAKMEQMGVKWTDPMDYDVQLDRCWKASPSDEKTIVDEVAAAFHEIVVPGGQQYVLAAKINFFKFKKENKKEEKKGIHEKEKEKSTDVPSKSVEVPSNQKANKVVKGKAAQKNKKTSSTTSSASRQTPPSPVEPAAVPPVTAMAINKKPAVGVKCKM